MYKVYILYSNLVNGFYIGISLDVEQRVFAHNSKKYDKSYTKKADDWEIFLTINCHSKNQALQIEKHIKRMKSADYISNLKKYSEIVEKLLLFYV